MSGQLEAFEEECEHCECWEDGRRCCQCGANEIEWPECDEDDDDSTD